MSDGPGLTAAGLIKSQFCRNLLSGLALPLRPTGCSLPSPHHSPAHSLLRGQSSCRPRCCSSSSSCSHLILTLCCLYAVAYVFITCALFFLLQKESWEKMRAVMPSSFLRLSKRCNLGKGCRDVDGEPESRRGEAVTLHHQRLVSLQRPVRPPSNINENSPLRAHLSDTHVRARDHKNVLSAPLISGVPAARPSL